MCCILRTNAFCKLYPIPLSLILPVKGWLLGYRVGNPVHAMYGVNITV